MSTKYYVYFHGGISNAVLKPLMGIAKFEATESPKSWFNSNNTWENIYDLSVVPTRIRKEDDLVFDTLDDAFTRLRELIAEDLEVARLYATMLEGIMADTIEAENAIE